MVNILKTDKTSLIFWQKTLNLSFTALLPLHRYKDKRKDGNLTMPKIIECIIY